MIWEHRCQTAARLQGAISSVKSQASKKEERASTRTESNNGSASCMVMVIVHNSHGAYYKVPLFIIGLHFALALISHHCCIWIVGKAPRSEVDPHNFPTTTAISANTYCGVIRLPAYPITRDRFLQEQAIPGEEHSLVHRIYAATHDVAFYYQWTKRLASVVLLEVKSTYQGKTDKK